MSFGIGPWLSHQLIHLPGYCNQFVEAPHLMRLARDIAARTSCRARPLRAECRSMAELDAMADLAADGLEGCEIVHAALDDFVAAAKAA